ncbi:MAG: glycerate kinase [Leptolyngbyaceae cyanobacterium SM1_4_3]|nr:glycerate kinase [Leptolyngbyaceae cyanobacterium SM1_4_3]
MQLETFLLADEQSNIFGVTASNVKSVVQQRSHLLQQIYPEFDCFCRNNLGWQTYSLETLWNLWLPLATDLAEKRRQLERPLIQGILGGQGTGKTTLATILTLILKHLGYQACSLSLDDLYKTYADRLHLQQADPRLRWRGPPGTHDIQLGLTTLQQLRSAERCQPVQLPRFDKSAWDGAGDRTQPETVTGVDIVLFEGWFVGVQPIDPIQFETAPPPIVSPGDRAFAREINQRLHDYLPLWEQLDSLILLYPADYRLSQQWRQQAEQKMKATGRPGMSDAEIEQFVSYFWRSLHPDLFVAPLRHNLDRVDLVIEINPDHLPGAVYRPG